MTDMGEYTTAKLQEIKRDFFSYRNGIVAEALRKLYKPGKIIFGLTVPQFIEMGKKYPKDNNLGRILWEDNTSREARLFSLYLIKPEGIDLPAAKKMVQDVVSTEEAEFLSFKVLARMPNAKTVYETLSTEDFQNPFSLHCLHMLKKNVYPVS